MVRARSALKNMEGVFAWEASRQDNSLLLAYESRATNLERIMAQLAQKGYQVAGQPEVTTTMPCN